jgi:hypothetical protein
MKIKMMNKYNFLWIGCVALLLQLSSCGKDDYYIDGGKAKAEFDGTVLQYLQSNPKFDTIAQIIKLAEMEDVFTKEEITFFAPTDEVVRRTIGNMDIGGLNRELFNAGKDTIRVLSDVPTEIWKRHLMKYMLKGKYLLKDFPQLDFDLRPLYPGSYYFGYNDDLFNIGVVYNSSNGVKYAGYRQLSISYVPDPSNPNSYIVAAVASSDIQPTNGVVHALAIHIGNDNIGATPISSASNVFGLGSDFNKDVVLEK